MEAMFEEIRQRILSISAWMESFYSCQPCLFLGIESIKATVGCSKALDPLRFAWTFHHCVECIKKKLKILGAVVVISTSTMLPLCPTAFLASSSHSQSLISRMLGHYPGILLTYNCLYLTLQMIQIGRV